VYQINSPLRQLIPKKQPSVSQRVTPGMDTKAAERFTK